MKKRLAAGVERLRANPIRSLAALALLVSASVIAHHLTAGLAVNVNVAGTARIDAQQGPATLVVAPGDVERGYVETVEPVVLSIFSNAHGYELDVEPTPGLFSAVTLQLPDATITLGPEGGTFTERNMVSTRVSVPLRLRFVLAEGLQPGEYPWPVRFAVRPLPEAAR